MPPAPSVDAEKILRKLREQWAELGREQQEAGGILRACAMTLIAIAETPGDAESVRRIVGVLMHDHPSRAVIVCPREGAELSARIFSECWIPFGGRQQICAEGIEISADPVLSGDVARLLVPLIMPDLPVVLWCRGGRAFLDRTLDPLFPVAGKVIFDTALARHAPSAIEFLKRLRQEGRRVADLAWTRLTGFREAVAQAFDEGLGVAGLKSALVHYAGPKPDSGTLYFARWIEASAAGLDVALEPAPGPSGAEFTGLQGVRLVHPGMTVAIRRADSSTLEIQAGSRRYRSPLPPVSEDALLREEMSILEVDPVFERTLG